MNYDITAKRDKIRSEQGYYQAVGMKWQLAWRVKRVF